MWKDYFQFLTLRSTKLRINFASNSFDKLIQLILVEPHIYDLDMEK